MQAAVLFNSGARQSVVVDQLRPLVSRQSVCRWHEKWKKEGGIQGLKRKPHPGKKPKLTDKEFKDSVPSIKSISENMTYQKYGGAKEIVDQIIDLIMNMYGNDKDYSRRHIYRIREKIGWTLRGHTAKPKEHSTQKNEGMKRATHRGNTVQSRLG